MKHDIEVETRELAQQPKYTVLVWKFFGILPNKSLFLDEIGFSVIKSVKRRTCSSIETKGVIIIGILAILGSRSLPINTHLNEIRHNILDIFRLICCCSHVTWLTEL